MKKCCKCGIEKDVTEFFFKNKKKGLLHTTCKSCKRTIDRDAYSENRYNRKQKIRETSTNNKLKLKEYVNEIKQNSECQKCGEKKWYVLDFHHTHDKDDSISNIIKIGSLKRLKIELSKCVILCSNCHREHHHFERELEQKLT